MIPFPFTFHPPGPIDTRQWIIVLLAGFLLLAFLIYKFGLPALGGLLQERQRAIAEAAQQVELTLREAEQMREDYRNRLEHIEDEAEARMNEAVREAELLRDQILTDAQRDAEHIVQRGRQEVERERAKARVRLQQEFVDDVIDAAEHAAENGTTEGQHRTLVQQFIQNVGAKA